MCGRFFIEPEDPAIRVFLEQVNRSPLAGKFRERGIQPVPASGEIVPSAVVPVMAMNRRRERKVFPMQWGFTLKNGSGKGKGRLIINARSETASEKPLFREAWVSHRCVIPASRYFEWEHTVLPDGRKKTGGKFAIRPRKKGTVWLAGLYRMEGELPVFTVLTRTPSADVSWLHDRMPLMLPEESVSEWIRPEGNPGEIQKQALTALAYESAPEISSGDSPIWQSH